MPIPFECSAGYLGSAQTALQGDMTCAGKCRAGTYCPTKVSLVEILCPKGNYCPEGSTAPRPCPEGTYGASVGLTSMAACTACPAGYWCSSGLLISCPENTFNDEVDKAVPAARSPTDMLGEVVLKYVEGHGIFMGTIVEYDQHTGFRLQYDDGDTEDVSLRDLRALMPRAERQRRER